MNNAGKAPKISKIQNIAVYDPKDGRIIHMHRAVIFEGAHGRALESAERDALEQARRIGHDTSALKTLAHDGHLAPGRLSIDLKKNAIVSQPTGFHRPGTSTRK